MGVRKVTVKNWVKNPKICPEPLIIVLQEVFFMNDCLLVLNMQNLIESPLRSVIF